LAKKPSKSLVRKKPEASGKADKTADELFDEEFAEIEAELETEEKTVKGQAKAAKPEEAAEASVKPSKAAEGAGAAKARARAGKATDAAAGETAEARAEEETAAEKGEERKTEKEKAEKEKPARKPRREEKHEEHIYVVPLRVPRGLPAYKRAERSIRDLREYLARHTKTPVTDVHIDASINRLVWAGGGKHLPARIRVRAMKFEDGVVEAEALAE